MANRHPLTGEPIPPNGFPRLPDGRELRQTISAARIVGVVPAHMSTMAQRHGLTVFAGQTGSPGRRPHYYLLEELLALRAERSSFKAVSTPTDFTPVKGPDEQ